MCKPYNGYANYETWAVSLWIDNDPGLYSEIQEMAESCYDEDDDRKGRDELATQLKDYIEEMNPLLDDANMFSDLMGAALDNVEWYEIADNWIEVIEEERV